MNCCSRNLSPTYPTIANQCLQCQEWFTGFGTIDPEQLERMTKNSAEDKFTCIRAYATCSANEEEAMLLLASKDENAMCPAGLFQQIPDAMRGQR